MLQFDNGPEFTGRHFVACCTQKKLELVACRRVTISNN
jgi:hypothetical protein